MVPLGSYVTIPTRDDREGRRCEGHRKAGTFVGSCDDHVSGRRPAARTRGGTLRREGGYGRGGRRNRVGGWESGLSQAQAQGPAVLYDARGQSEDQIFDQYLDRFSAQIAVEQTETKPAYLRDFAVQNNAFT